ncbi:hypothetical protein HY030_04300 [Candidatus Gottesmanbacteria bacterium]|nr:hypothetical protein [Candidatus Gottesmanbacteria bacterium]
MKEYPRTEEVLRLLAGGAVLTSLILSPHLTLAAISTFKLFHDWNNYSSFQLKRTVERLRKRKMVKIVERENETVVELSGLGRKELLRYDISKMQIPKPRKWDGKWWLVIFDIPEIAKNRRNIFQKKLKTLGFHFIQKSVCIHPYPCQKEIEFLREVYGIKKGVDLLRVEFFEKEYLVRDKFNL